MTKGKAKYEEEDVYTMEGILEYKKQRGKDMYLVKWLGYPSSEATWEPEKNIFDPSDDIIKQMHELKVGTQKTQSPVKRKSAPPKISVQAEEPPAPPAKKLRSSQSKTDTSDKDDKAGKSDKSEPARSGLKCSVSRLSMKNLNGANEELELTATLDFANGETKNVNVATAREEYTQELMDFLLSRVRFRTSS